MHMAELSIYNPYECCSMVYTDMAPAADPPETDIACLAVLCSSSCPQCTSLQGILYVLGLLKQLLGAVKLLASIHHGSSCHRSGY